MATTTFTALRTVAVPVSDQERARSVFEQLGFTTTFDAELQPGFRWIELGLPGGPTTLALVAAGPDLPSEIDTGIRLVTADARAAHTTVAGLGLEVGELLDWESAPLMFSFADHDGNRFYVSQDDAE